MKFPGWWSKKIILGVLYSKLCSKFVFPRTFFMHKKLILKSETLHVLMFVMLDRGLTFFYLENKSRRPLKNI